MGLVVSVFQFLGSFILSPVHIVAPVSRVAHTRARTHTHTHTHETKQRPGPAASAPFLFPFFCFAHGTLQELLCVLFVEVLLLFQELPRCPSIQYQRANPREAQNH